MATRNPRRDKVQQVQDLRRCNASSKHNPLPRKQRTRSGRERAAKKDQER